MASTVATTWFSRSFMMRTMWRSDWESTSLNTYFPAGRICPGISTGCENVTMVRLSHASAWTGGANVTSASAHATANASTTDKVFFRLISDDLRVRVVQMRCQIAKSNLLQRLQILPKAKAVSMKKAQGTSYRRYN